MADVEPLRFKGISKANSWPFDRLAGQGLAFASAYPPLLTKDTIIIAVCGPNDFNNNASARKGGWIFSDFYLFHHLLKGTATDQFWMTCVNPKILVDKYKSLSHGDERWLLRRTVLDASLLNQVQDVQVYSGDELLYRFLKLVIHTSKQVRGSTRPILLMMFGHGGADYHSITMGGTGDFHECPVLTRSVFRDALLRHNSNPNFALFTSSCFVGGWIQTPYPDVNEMAEGAAALYKELISWPVTDFDGTLGRCCGSRYAVGVTEALFRSRLRMDLGNEEHQHIRLTAPYHELIDGVREILKKYIDDRIGHSVSFDNNDDLWGSQYRRQTGWELDSYLAKWKLLDLGTNGDPYSNTVTFDDKILLSPQQAVHRLKRLAHDYMNSHPGDDTAPENKVLHGYCRCILYDEENLNLFELRQLAGALPYRLGTIMGVASEYREHLNLSFPECRDFDCEDFEKKYQQRRGEEEDNRRSIIFQIVKTRHLFDDAAPFEGEPSEKGNKYLAWALVMSGWNIETVQDRLKELYQLRRK